MRDRLAAAQRRTWTFVDVVGVVLLIGGFVALLILDGMQGTLRDEFVGNTIGAFLVAFLGFGLLLGLQSERDVSFDWRWLLVVGLLLRLSLVSTVPTLSDDVYRYLWEGHLVTNGVSPYSFPIEAPEGDPFDIEARGQANTQSFASPYLPVAHLVFAATVAIGPASPWVMQVVMIGFDVVALAALIKLLRAVGLPERRSLIYWLNPLVIVEVGHGAHLDAIIVGLTMVSLWLTFDVAKRRHWAVHAAPLALAAATLTRPLALLLTPVLFWVWRWPQRILYGAAVLLPIVVTGLWVGFGVEDPDGTGLFGSVLRFAETFRFNTAVYQAIERWIGTLGVDDPLDVTRIGVTVVVVAAMLMIFLWSSRPRTELATVRLLLVPVVVYVLASPVLHPWYTLLLLALLPFVAPEPGEPKLRWALVAPWLVLAALLIFSYLTYLDPDAHAELSWVRHLEWYPTLGLLLLAFAARVRIGRVGNNS